MGTRARTSAAGDMGCVCVKALAPCARAAAVVGSSTGCGEVGFGLEAQSRGWDVWQLGTAGGAWGGVHIWVLMLLVFIRPGAGRSDQQEGGCINCFHCGGACATVPPPLLLACGERWMDDRLIDKTL